MPLHTRVRSIPQVFKHSSCLQFADDISFYVRSADSALLTEKLQADITSLDAHLDDIGLQLNPSKTKLVVLRRSTRSACGDISLVCKGHKVEPVPSARYLGVLVDQHLLFDEQVSHVCQKAYAKVATFRHGRRHIALSARRLFYLSIVQSTLDYASNSYVHCLSHSAYNKLLTASRVCMRRVFGWHRFTPGDVILSRHNLYSLENRLNLKLYVFVFRCMSPLISPLAASIFVPRSVSSCTRSFHQRPSYCCTCSPQGSVQVWN